MDILFWIGVFVISLAFLIKSSDYFIEYAERIGLSLGLSPVIIGTLILAFGTSLPELVTSVIAVLSNNSEIVMGNVVGSNIANVLMVGGVLMLTATKVVLHPAKFKLELIGVPLVSVILWYMVFDLQITAIESIVLLILYLVYLYIVLKSSSNETEKHIHGEGENEGESLVVETTDPIKWHYWAILVGGAIGIYFGAEYTVTSIVKLSELLNIGKDVISLSAVALGTSLPELVVSVVSARKGNVDMAMGNILGSNIFNILAIVSIPSFLGPLAITQGIVNVSLPVMVFVAFLIVGIVLTRRIKIWAGMVLVLLYVLYNIELFSGVFTKALGLL